ncbi:heavy metal translocating P-type ATPase [Lentibacter sp. XHP0401]|uniref:heavy metal translocating P-type ATPase n=1 Tax=Lentibacter sp. XHP0401 TaxID=2984334 RepID=UPI0021E7DCE4|nr:heavy metal translocating P-type ATPase [Lentibacter sp. XHP0401]MCV2894473.1 heavy metal translocating P-type ATPase [Lentibacter sp. XHP0401]
MSKIELSIEGLSCAGCVRRAEEAIAGVEGASEVSVNLATRRASLDLGDAGLEDVTQALTKAGYPARVESAVFVVEGMSCASCVGRVEAAVRGLEGVTEANVSFAAGELRVTYLERVVSEADIIAAVKSAGYAAVQKGTGPSAAERRAEEVHGLKRSFLIALALALPVFLLEMGGHIYPPFHHWVAGTFGQVNSWIFQFVLTSAVLIWPGRKFYTVGLPLLMKGAPDMNSLVAVGTLAAYSYSVVATFAPGLLPSGARAVYFEAAAVIVTLILLGRYLEARAKGRAGEAIAKLVELAPTRVEIKRGDAFEEADASDVRAGDVLRLRPGVRVPVDGAVTRGESHVDESMLTGEPMAVRKSEGDALIAGTVNGAGALEMMAEKVGADTVLAGIVRTVEEAQVAKLPIQALVDRVTMWFVPVVMGFAVLTLLAWLAFGAGIANALVAAVSVLIIACPCAMGLATPMSIMVGTGRGAELGVFFRKGDALQRLSDVRTVAFDKTGTLTEGKPKLTDFEALGGFEKAEALRFVAAAEQGSEHPVARAIVAAHEGAMPAAESFEAIAGQGVAAQVEGREVLIGTVRLMREQGVALDGRASALEAAGKSVSYAAIDGQIAALFAVSDALKPDAVATVKALHEMGLKTVMITGDSAAAARFIADEAGIDEVIAEVMPEGKLDAIRKLQEQGPVAFVGDGINDAPALSAADVGIAVGTGTDVAIESAEVVLMTGAPDKALVAVRLARKVMRNIRQNLFWAFAYNAALIPVAAGLLYPLTGWLLSPMLAAGAMALSSVFVVSNALRLKRA